MPMMDMGKKMDKEMMGAVPGNENKISYPSFYVDRELSLSDKDVGKEIMAVCKLKLRSCTKRADKHGKEESYSFDVMGMDLAPKKQGHYAKA